MPAKKAPDRKNKPTPKARTAAPSQFDSLRKTVKELRARLEKEVKARKIEARVVAEAKKAREQLNNQVKALRDQGAKLASELRSALGDSKQYEKARKEAHKKIDQLRNELSQKTAELRRKTDELRKLAEESAHRAAEIIRSDAPTASEPVAEVPTPGMPSEGTVAHDADSGDKEPSA